MDVDSFKGKLLISLIDKLLIGLAASGLVLYFQYAQRDAQLVNEQRRAVGRVWTQEVTEQRTELAKSVAEFVELVDQLAPTGQARGDVAERLDRVHGDIDSAVSWLRRIHTFIPEREGATCYPRDEAVLVTFTTVLANDLTLPMLSGRLEPEARQASLGKVLATYVEVLTFVRCLALDAFHYETA